MSSSQPDPYKTPTRVDTVEIRPELSARQFEYLVTACDLGYFEWPREACQDDIAEALGTTQATVTKMVRYGVRKLAESYVEAAREHGSCPLCGEDVTDIRGQRMLTAHLPNCEGGQ